MSKQMTVIVSVPDGWTFEVLSEVLDNELRNTQIKVDEVHGENMLDDGSDW